MILFDKGCWATCANRIIYNPLTTPQVGFITLDSQGANLVADFTGDSKTDILNIPAAESNSLWDGTLIKWGYNWTGARLQRGSATRSFSAVTVPQMCSSLAGNLCLPRIGRFNGDQEADLIGEDMFGSISTYHGSSTGTFTAIARGAFGSTPLAIADFSRDGVDEAWTTDSGLLMSPPPIVPNSRYQFYPSAQRQSVRLPRGYKPLIGRFDTTAKLDVYWIGSFPGVSFNVP